MIIATLLPLLTLFGEGPPGGPVPIDIPEPEGVVRSYDLAAVGSRCSRAEGYTSLFPASLVSVFGNDVEDQESTWSLEPDFIVDVLLTLCGEEFEYEGRFLSLDEENRLRVRAPVQVHEKLSRVLAFLGQATSAHTELQVDVIHLPFELAGNVEATGLVSMAEADRLRTLESNGARVESYTLNLRPGSASRLDLSTRHQLLLDYDVEVAQQAFIHDPVIRTLITGTRLEVRGAPLENGVGLALTFVQGTPIGAVEEVELRQEGFISSERGGGFVSGPRRMQRLDIANRALALNTVLPDGKALVFRSSLDLAGARGTQLVVLRRAGAPLQGTHRLVLEEGVGTDLYLISGEALTAPRVRLEGALFAGLLSRLPLDRLYLGDQAEESLISAACLQGSSDGAWELMQMSRPDLQLEGGDVWTVAMPLRASRQSQRAGGGARSAGQVPEMAEVLRSLAGDEEVVHLSLELKRRGAGASQGLACDLVLGVGQRSAVVLGVEGTMVPDHDVEIAQSSAAADPIVQLAFDGLALSIEPRRGVGGKLSLELLGVAHLLREKSKFDSGSPTNASLEQALFDRLVVEEVLEVEKEGKGTFVIGDGSRNGGDGALVLTVRVR